MKGKLSNEAHLTLVNIKTANSVYDHVYSGFMLQDLKTDYFFETDS